MNPFLHITENSSTFKKIVIGVVVVFLLYKVGHSFFASSTLTIPPPQVIIQKPKLVGMVEYVTQTGSTVAYNSVDLVARVEGFLRAIDFVDGSVVEKGQPLFVIQPEPYLEQLKAAQATVAAQKAAYAYSKSEYARQQRMYKSQATSLNNVEKWLAKTHEDQAEVDKAIANEVIAEITYGYTHVAAPFTGRMGRHRIDIGNLVGNGVATNLATIEQIAPLYVYFNLNELDFLKLRSAARAAGFKPTDLNKIPVDISLQNEAGVTHKATLDFVNTGLDASTGTMEMRAVLPNTDWLFVPGLFVQVRIAVTKPVDQLTVPSTAVLYDQIGPYLLLVDKNDAVVLQRIKLGLANAGRQAITQGLKAQDRVITDGLQNATPGNKVTPKEAVVESPQNKKASL